MFCKIYQHHVIYVVGDGVVEQVNALEYKAEILHQAVHVIVPHILAAQDHTSTVHIPETGQQMAQRGLAAAGLPHNSVLDFWENIQRNSLNNWSSIAGKSDIFCPEIAVLRLLLCTGKIHGGQIQNIIGLIDTGIHNPQQARLRARLFQPLVSRKEQMESITQFRSSMRPPV